MDQENQITDAGLAGLIDVAMKISQKRRNILQRMRAALERGDNAEALKFARELCGLHDDETSDRVDSGFH
jgi:hypothetical protein